MAATARTAAVVEQEVHNCARCHAECQHGMRILVVSVPSFELSSRKEMFSLTPQSCRHPVDHETSSPSLYESCRHPVDHKTSSPCLYDTFILEMSRSKPCPTHEKAMRACALSRAIIAQPTVWWWGATAYSNTREQPDFGCPVQSLAPLSRKAVQACALRATVAQKGAANSKHQKMTEGIGTILLWNHRPSVGPNP